MTIAPGLVLAGLAAGVLGIILLFTSLGQLGNFMDFSIREEKARLRGEKIEKYTGMKPERIIKLHALSILILMACAAAVSAGLAIIYVS